MATVVVQPQRTVVVVRRAAVVVQANPVIVVIRPTEMIVKATTTPPPRVLVMGKGLRGEAGPQNLFVHPAPAPVFEFPGVWVETGLGTAGEDMTFWVEDGT